MKMSAINELYSSSAEQFVSTEEHTQDFEQSDLEVKMTSD